MRICQSAKICEKQQCPHKNAHVESDEPENSCTSPCDVTGGITGSICVQKDIIENISANSNHNKKRENHGI